VVAASQGSDLLEGLVVNADRMAATAREAGDTLTAEQRSVSGASGTASGYLGGTDLIIDNILERAARVWSNL
jgi:3-carboxy-cis,cis-muconate cycloisomerase